MNLQVLIEEARDLSGLVRVLGTHDAQAAAEDYLLALRVAEEMTR